MATLRKRGSRWQVQVRRVGQPPLSKSFLLKADAETWARQQETLADRGERLLAPSAMRALKTITVADLITRYRDEVMLRKHRGFLQLKPMVDAFLRRPIASTKLAALTVTQANDYVTERLKTVKPGSICRELDVPRHAFNVAKRTWKIPLAENVFAQVERPTRADARERRLEKGERCILVNATNKCRNRWVRPLIELAVETGMRRSEILNASGTTCCGASERFTSPRRRTRTRGPSLCLALRSPC